METIRLVQGTMGKPGVGMCWMSALDYFQSGGASWGDSPRGVDCVVRKLCMVVNDRCPPELLSELVLPRIFAPMGTESNDAQVLVERRLAIISWAKRIGCGSVSLATHAYGNLGDVLAHALHGHRKAVGRESAAREAVKLIDELCSIGMPKELPMPSITTKDVVEASHRPAVEKSLTSEVMDFDKWKASQDTATAKWYVTGDLILAPQSWPEPCVTLTQAQVMKYGGLPGKAKRPGPVTATSAGLIVERPPASELLKAYGVPIPQVPQLA